MPKGKKQPMLPAIEKMCRRQQIQRKVLKLCTELEYHDVQWLFQEALRLPGHANGPVPIKPGEPVDAEVSETPAQVALGGVDGKPF